MTPRYAVPRSVAVLALLVLAALPGEVRGQIPLRAHYDDDFILESEDGEFLLRIRGNLHLDTRLYTAENLGAPQNTDVRRARIDFQGRIHERFTFRIQPELSGSPYVRNAWADWAFLPALHLRWGQMKVPFSSSWLTQDNNLNFVERGTAGPIHPFFDRGFVVWGDLFDGVATYDLGVFTGVGTDADVPGGDLDSGKEWAARLFFRPLARSTESPLRGLVAVVGGTWAGRSVPTSRYETRGLRAADYGAAIWRWRTEQLLGTDGRAEDRIVGEVGSRRRLGAELHWLIGPVVLSSELLELRYADVNVAHELRVGSRRVVRVPIQTRSGAVRSWSTWVSWYPTGEAKRLTDGGWRTARPAAFVHGDGAGAWEVLARYSRTVSDYSLFRAVDVGGFQRGDPGLGDYEGPLPGAGHVVRARILDGAHTVNEVSVGINWSVNPMVRLQLNDVFLWAPAEDRTGDGVNDNLLISGAFTARSDPEVRDRRTQWQNAVMLRLVFKL